MDGQQPIPEEKAANLNEADILSSVRESIRTTPPATSTPAVEETPPPPETPSPQLPKKKFPLIPVLVFLALVLVIAFGFPFIKNLIEKSNKSTKPVETITYWGLWEPEAVMQGVFTQWEKENNAKVNYVKQDKEDYRQRLQSAFSRGDGPDIFRFHQTWVPMLRGDLAVLPAETVSSLGLGKDYPPVMDETIKISGQYHGVPLMADALALYYNKDILSAANKTPPRTWWGLENLAKELTVKPEQKITIAGVALGSTKNVDHWSDILGLMIYQNGGNPALPDDFVKDAINYYLRFKNSFGVWDETLPRSTLAFADGKLAFYIAPSWRIFNLLEVNPNLNFGVSNIPQLPKSAEADLGAAERGEEELTSVGWSTFWVEGVWVKSKQQKLAWKLLEFLASKEGLQKLYEAQSQTRLFGEIYPRTDLAASLETDPLLKPFVFEMKNAKNWYLSSFTHDVGINDRMITYYENAVNAVGEGGNIETTFETLDAGINQVLVQYQLSPLP